MALGTVQVTLLLQVGKHRMMPQELEAVFDGTALQLEVPLNLAAGTRVRIIIESVLPNEVKPPKTFLQTAQSLTLHGDPDWSEKIDQFN